MTVVEPNSQHYIAALVAQRDDALNKLANSDAMIQALREQLAATEEQLASTNAMLVEAVQANAGQAGAEEEGQV